MDRPNLPLTALRAFETAARQGSFTRAGLELRVSQTAVSHQVIALEARLGVQLFRRTPKGLILTDEGQALLPILTDAFDRVGDVLDRFADGRFRESLALGVVTTFAVGWLMPRLVDFTDSHPWVDLRISTHNNRVDLTGEGLEMAIRFGDGAWTGLSALPLQMAPLTPLCAPDLARRMTGPGDLAQQTLLRSYRPAEWPAWFARQGLACPDLRGPVFDSSIAMAQVAAEGHGVALLPAAMFARSLSDGHLARPFAAEIQMGRYWLVHPKPRPQTAAMQAFSTWLLSEVGSP